MIRVLHCDDSAAFRLLVRALLDTEDDIELVGEATDRDSLRAALERTRPDVVLLDLVPGVSGADVAGVPVVILSGHAPEHAEEGLRAAALAHVVKSASLDGLPAALRDAADRKSTNVH